VIVSFAAVIGKRSLRLSEALLALLAIYMGFYASRNIPVSSILLVLIVGPLLPQFGPITDFTERMSAVDARLRGHVWPVVFLALVFLVCLNKGGIGGKIVADAHFDPIRMPVGAVDDLDKKGITEPVLTPDYWGGYVIYRLYPKNKVVIDDRHDLYGAQILTSYLKMVRPQPGWDEFLRDYKVSCMIIPRNAQITALLKESPGWKSVYSDGVAVTFMKVDPTRQSANHDSKP
jgi:hypothetical protein